MKKIGILVLVGLVVGCTIAVEIRKNPEHIKIHSEIRDKAKRLPDGRVESASCSSYSHYKDEQKQEKEKIEKLNSANNKAFLQAVQFFGVEIEGESFFKDECISDNNCEKEAFAEIRQKIVGDFIYRRDKLETTEHPSKVCATVIVKAVPKNENRIETPNGIDSDNDHIPKDSDRDGVADYQDDCPYEAREVDANGCPKDSDRDGVPDYQDNCPHSTSPEVDPQTGCPLYRPSIKTINLNNHTLEFVYVQGSVHLSGFFMANTETAFALFDTFLWEERHGLNRFDFDDSCIKKMRQKHPSKFKHLPVVCVSEYGIKKFVNWLGEKTGENIVIPSCQQWRHVATKGGEYSHCGNHQPCHGNHCKDNIYRSAELVGVRSAKSTQVPHFYEMCGNVTEACINDKGEYSQIGPFVGCEDSYQKMSDLEEFNAFSTSGFRLAIEE